MVSTNYYSAYLVSKKSWTRSYSRVFTICDSGISTLDPSNLKITNKLDFSDIEGIEDSDEDTFIINIMKGKLSSMSNKLVLSCKNKVDLLTDLYIYSTISIPCSNSETISAVEKYSKRQCSILIQQYGLKIKEKNRNIVLRLFKDYNRILAKNDTLYIIKNDTLEHIAFEMKNPEQVLKTVVRQAKSSLSLDIIEDQSYNTSIGSLGIFGGTADMVPQAQFELDRIVNDVPEKVYMVLCLRVIMIKDCDTMQVIDVLRYEKIFAISINSNNSHEFTIHWTNSYPPMETCFCYSRDYLICTLIDTARLCQNVDIHVTSDFKRELRYGPLTETIDQSIEKFLLQRLSNTDYESICAFNANVSYSGYKVPERSMFFASSEQATIQSTLISLLNVEFNLSDHNYMELYYYALRRIFATKPGFKLFSSENRIFTKMGAKVFPTLSTNNKMVIFAFMEMMSALIKPLHVDADLAAEKSNKSIVLSHEKLLTDLIKLFETQSTLDDNALVISSFLDFFTYIICPPYRETTHVIIYEKFIGFLKEKAKRLFSLCAHQSASVVKAASLIVKVLIEQSKEEERVSLQDLALSNGACLSHVLRACFDENLFTRQLSRHFLALWLHKNDDGHALMKRIFPIGLYSLLLQMNRVASEDHLALKSDRDNQALVNDYIKKNSASEVVMTIDGYMKSWHDKLSEKLKTKTKYNQIVNPTLELEKYSDDVVTDSFCAYNWNLFFEYFNRDHVTPALIWNHQTRFELRSSIEKQLAALKSARDYLSSVHEVAWNHEEFFVEYPSLTNEVKISDYYLRPLLESHDNSLSSIPDSYKFFSEIYHNFLQSTMEESKCIYIDAMIKLYAHDHKDIGKFTNTSYVVYLLTQTYDFRQRDLLVNLLGALCKNKDNIRLVIAEGGIQNLVNLATLAHTTSERLVLQLEKNMIEGLSDLDNSNDASIWKIKGDEATYSYNDLKAMYEDHKIEAKTKIWSSGMIQWTPMCDLAQFKWGFMATGTSIYTPLELCCKILDILISICTMFPNLNPSKALLQPQSQINCILSSTPMINHICQLLLTYNHLIVTRVVQLISLVMTESPALSKLYLSGFFYFVMVYTGSDVEEILKFLKYSHIKQDFMMESKFFKTPLIKKSVLAPMLPEALICFLIDKDENSTLSNILLGEQNTPHIIWSESMRKYMIGKVSQHLSDFIPLLKQNIQTVYKYSHIPYIEYEELKNKMFCGGLYLQNFCDLEKFGEYHVSKPVKFLNDLINEWRNLLVAENTPSNINRYYQILELDSEVEYTDAQLRRKYLILANKYHPDKCKDEDAATKFMEINEAYSFFCSPDAKISFSIEESIALILNSQIILFERHSKQLEAYRYSGFNMLFETLKNQFDMPDKLKLFTEREEPCLFYLSLKLLEYTCKCAKNNCVEWISLETLSFLSSLIKFGTECISSLSKVPDSFSEILLYLYKIINHVSDNALFATYLGDDLSILHSIDEIMIHHKTLPEHVLSASKIILSLCFHSTPVDDIFKTSIPFHMIYLLFIFDVTAQIDDKKVSDSTQKQILLNEISVICSNVFCHIYRMGTSQNACSLLKYLFPEYILHLMAIDDRSILHTLNTDNMYPWLLWNTRTRSQLVDLVDGFRKSKTDEDPANIAKCSEFSYDAYKEHFIVGGILVDIFNSKPNMLPELLPKVFTSFQNFITDSPLMRYHSPGNISTADGSEIDVAQSQTQLVQVLIALKSLLNVSRKIYKTLVISITGWSIVFKMNHLRPVHFALLDLISEILKMKEPDVLFDYPVLVRVTMLLYDFPPENIEKLFEVLTYITAYPEMVKSMFSIGIHVYLVNILCQSQDMDMAKATATVINSILRDKASSDLYKAAIRKMIPLSFVDVLSEEYELIYNFLKSDQETPELFWNSEIRAKTYAEIKVLFENCHASLIADEQSHFVLDNRFYWDISNGTDIIVSGVNVNLFIKTPTHNLRRAMEFYNEMFKLSLKYIVSNDISAPSDKISLNQVLDILADGLILFLKNNPVYKSKSSKTAQGHVNKLIEAMCVVDIVEWKRAHLMKIIIEITSDISCAKDFLSENKVFAALVHWIKNEDDNLNYYTSLLSSLTDQLAQTPVSIQNLSPEILVVLFQALENPASKVSQAKEIRACVVKCLQNFHKLVANYPHLLNVYTQFKDIWAIYESQKQDLFLKDTFAPKIEQAPRAALPWYADQNAANAPGSQATPGMWGSQLSLDQKKRQDKPDDDDYNVPTC